MLHKRSWCYHVALFVQLKLTVLSTQKGYHCHTPQNGIVYVHGEILYIAGTKFTTPHPHIGLLFVCRLYMMSLPKTRSGVIFIIRVGTKPRIKVRSRILLLKGVWDIVGGSTATAFAKHYVAYTTTYGALAVEMPTLSWQTQPIKPCERYIHSGDPISVSEACAETVPVWGVEATVGMHNPHTYTGYADGNSKEQRGR